MRNNKLTIALGALLVLASILIGIRIYDQLPEQMASHWNGKGQVDDTMTKFWGTFLIPIVNVAMLLMFMVLPLIDPLRKNIQQFRKYYNGFILLMVVFLTYVHFLTLAWNVGLHYNMENFIFPAIAILFFYIGDMLRHSKRNWFIGIRNPWTLSSDYVWEKTNTLGGYLFMIFGLLMIVSLFLTWNFLIFIIIAIVVMMLALVVYSYVLYRKEEKATNVVT